MLEQELIYGYLNILGASINPNKSLQYKNSLPNEVLLNRKLKSEHFFW